MRIRREDARERATAQQAGMEVCPHPLLVEEVLTGGPWCSFA